MTIHTFRSTGNAYDRCQCDDTIRTGDMLVIESESIIGLAGAWPIAVTEAAGNLHHLDDDAYPTMPAGAWKAICTREQAIAAVRAAIERGWTLHKPWLRYIPIIIKSPDNDAVIPGILGEAFPDDEPEWADAYAAIKDGREYVAGGGAAPVAFVRFEREPLAPARWSVTGRIWSAELSEFAKLITIEFERRADADAMLTSPPSWIEGLVLDRNYAAVVADADATLAEEAADAADIARTHGIR